jgi:hypothetical protein
MKVQYLDADLMSSSDPVQPASVKASTFKCPFIIVKIYLRIRERYEKDRKDVRNRKGERGTRDERKGGWRLG